MAPAAELVVGYERRSAFGGSTRLLTSYQSHPELVVSGSQGAQVVRLASTQQFKLGDLIVLDAGALSKAERLRATNFSSEPFFRALVRPASGMLVEYRFAAGRELQSSEDLDHLKPALHLLTDAAGNPLSVKGSHHEVSVSRKMGGRVLQMAAYTDHAAHAAIYGRGTGGRSGPGLCFTDRGPHHGVVCDGGRWLCRSRRQPFAGGAAYKVAGCVVQLRRWDGVGRDVRRAGDAEAGEPHDAYAKPRMRSVGQCGARF